MDARVKKLKHRGLSVETAQKLVDAGFHTPKLIKAASNEALLSVGGVGIKSVDAIRAEIG